VSFRRRNYPEVLDNLLTQIIGGVAAETHPFPPPGAAADGPIEHVLERPKAQQLVSVYGTRNGESRLFRANTDYELRPDKQTVRWKSGGELPDGGTLVHVNYLREDSPPTLTDLQVGSVVRTLAESVSLEIARLYAQLQTVYDSAFIDTASGGALDKVVALLGIARVGADRPSTQVRFTRAAGSPGSITINAGTRIIDAQAKFEYETTTSVTMAPSQNTITVAARDLEEANDPVEASTLTILPLPIAGISEVTNPAPAARAPAAETDEELRRRAKNFLYGSERATLGALQQVLARQQMKGDVVEVAGAPGLIRITPHSADLTAERREQLLADIHASRPAGVVVELASALTPAIVNLDLRLVTTLRLPQSDVRRAHDQVRGAVAEYFSRLPTRENASLNQIAGRVLAVSGVEDVTVRSARVTSAGVEEERLDAARGIIELADEPTQLGELKIADDNLPTAVEIVVRFPRASAAPDPAAMQTALGNMFAYLGGLDPADTGPAAQARRTLNQGKFLRVLPLPGKPGADLPSFDTTDPRPELPAAAGIAPYAVTILIHQANGLSRVIDSATAVYVLAPEERLRLDALNVLPE
jgi:uncharacterized phage protein gp47/JayE